MDLLDEIIEKYDSRKHALYVSKNQQIVDFLNKLYPDYTLAHKVKFYRKGYTVQPVCKNCQGILHNPDKETCSRLCRDEYKKKTGKFQAARKKAEQTNIQRYGVNNPLKSSVIQQKRLDTMKEKYGSLVSPRTRQKAKERSGELIEKGRNTLMSRYGVNNPGQLPDHREKCVETLYKNYGTESYFKSTTYTESNKIKRSEYWDKFSPSTINVHEVYRTEMPNERISFACECGNEETIPHETFKWRIQNTGTPCIKCSDINYGSLKEQELAEWIKSLGVELQRNNRTILNGKELDVYIPSHNLAIEFNGLFWHNDLRIDKNYHYEKYLQCKKQNIRLIHIFEDEWDDRKEVCKSRIKNALGLQRTRLYARDCKIKEVNFNESKKFLDLYHLQGYAKASLRYGLFYDDDLISVMTFAKPNKSKGQTANSADWELLRYCSSVNIVGGANKLFKHFVKMHSPNSVLSFCDLRWGTGNVYETMGFNHVKDTTPGYWYIKGNKRIHRYQLRKKQHEPKNKTEYELRLYEGYLRIWDCGHSKYIWTR